MDWFETQGAIWSAPVVVGDTLYFGSDDNNLYALDRRSSSKRWHFETGFWVEWSPVVVDGIVYIGSSEAILYLLDRISGKLLLGYATRGNISARPL